MKGRKIPNCLRKYRRARGFTQREVARLLNLKSTSQISRWERGVCLPGIINLFMLAVLYNTMADALFIDLRRELREKLSQREEALKSEKEKKR